MRMPRLNLSIEFADGSKCIVEGVSGGFNVCGFGSGMLSILNIESSTLIGVSLSVDKPLSDYPISIRLVDLAKPSSIIGLTFLHLSRPFIGNAFGYYNYVAQGKEPRSKPPEDKPQYPPKMSYRGRLNEDPVDCWTYPYWASDYTELYPYTVMLLANSGGEYVALFTFSNTPITAWIEDGPNIRTYVGKNTTKIPTTYFASLSVSKDPYEAVRSAVVAASKVSVFKPRWLKRRPRFMDGLGWCSWNALLTEDLSHDNVVRIVKGLRNRGVPISWVIVDDGWQRLENGIMRSTRPDPAKFPKGFRTLIDELKALGVRDAGLWFTINMYWNGVTGDFLNELNSPGFKTNRGFVPEPSLEGAFRLYDAWLRLLRDEGFSFVKVDNQWSVHHLYRGFVEDAEAAKSVELALQLAAETNELDILNCMSMLPGNYSNYAISNAMRISIDYIPMWRTDAKLHTMWSAYNSILYSFFGYPDYDMWMSYDPSAKLIAISRVFSGGPVYITDRDPERANVDLIRTITLSNGEVVRVDEPALPTKDVLFRNPYNEPILLKLASTVNGYPAVAFMNINKDDVEISEEFNLSNMPMGLNGRYIYYKVFGGEWGIVDSNSSIKVELNPLDAEVVVLAPVVAEKAVIGILGKVLPPYPLNIKVVDGEIVVESREEGELLVYRNGNVEKIHVKRGLIIKV